MGIEQIDKNFLHIEYKNSDSMKEYDVLEKPFKVYGMFYDKDREIVQGVAEGEPKQYGSFARVPHSISKQLSYGYDVMTSTTAGGRIRFSTDSNVIGVLIKWQYLVTMSSMPMSGYAGFVLVEEKEDGRRYIANFRPAPDAKRETPGFAETVDISKNFNDKERKMRNFIIYCPLYNDYIKEIKIILEKDAKVGEGLKYKDIKPIFYYGSSITQGGCVSRADNAYPALVERWTGVDFYNIGVSGSAKGEPLIAEYSASHDSSIFVYDYDHNAPTLEHLKNTHYNFYKIYRNKRPDTPIIFMTRPRFDKDIVEVDDRFRIVHGTYLRAKKEGDKNVYFIDGRKFYPNGEIGESCHSDFSHPNDLGHYFMAKAVFRVVDKILKNSKKY